MRVLLVEDNDDDALLIRESLSGTALEIDRAERLSTALAQLTLGKFDAVLLDLSLPDAWGLETIRRLRREAAAVPIVVLTGLNDEEIAMRAVEEGAQDYLFKGQADGHLLARSLRYAIQRHRAEETLKERNRELLILQKISETILGSLDLKAVLEKILEETMVTDSFDLGNIRLLDRSREMLEVVAGRGYRHSENVLGHRELARRTESGQSKFGDRLFREPCVEEKLQQCGGYRTLKKEGVESFIMVPVRANGEVVGTLQLASRTPRKFKPEEVNFLQTIGNQLGYCRSESAASRGDAETGTRTRKGEQTAGGLHRDDRARSAVAADEYHGGCGGHGCRDVRERVEGANKMAWKDSIQQPNPRRSRERFSRCFQT